jgi:hypothetical protein
MSSDVITNITKNIYKSYRCREGVHLPPGNESVQRTGPVKEHMQILLQWYRQSRSRVFLSITNFRFSFLLHDYEFCETICLLSFYLKVMHILYWKGNSSVIHFFRLDYSDFPDTICMVQTVSVSATLVDFACNPRNQHVMMLHATVLFVLLML